MVQPAKTNKKVTTVKKKKTKVTDKRLPPKPKNTPLRRSQRPHKEYGTSKLELRFAREFLDKLGVEYIYQFKAESIGRYFDFFCPAANVIIEVDGDYW